MLTRLWRQLYSSFSRKVSRYPVFIIAGDFNHVDWQCSPNSINMWSAIPEDSTHWTRSTVTSNWATELSSYHIWPSVTTCYWLFPHKQNYGNLPWWYRFCSCRVVGKGLTGAFLNIQTWNYSLAGYSVISKPALHCYCEKKHPGFPQPETLDDQGGPAGA